MYILQYISTQEKKHTQWNAKLSSNEYTNQDQLCVYSTEEATCCKQTLLGQPLFLNEERQLIQKLRWDMLLKQVIYPESCISDHW